MSIILFKDPELCVTSNGITINLLLVISGIINTLLKVCMYAGATVTKEDLDKILPLRLLKEN